MKTLNAKEIKGIAVDVFTRYPNAKKVAITSDGMAFITDQGDLSAKTYSRRNTSGKELPITNFTREECIEATAAKTANDDTSLTAAAVIELIKAAKTADEATAIKEKEAADKNRVSVINAADKRIEELTPKS